MPKVATSGFTNVVKIVEDTDFTFSAGDTLAAVTELTVARTIFLPGPNNQPLNGNLPANGDYYDVCDLNGRVNEDLALTIDGGGNKITQSGAPATTLVINETGFYCRFVFVQPAIDEDGVWAVWLGSSP